LLPRSCLGPGRDRAASKPLQHHHGVDPPAAAPNTLYTFARPIFSASACRPAGIRLQLPHGLSSRRLLCGFSRTRRTRRAYAGSTCGRPCSCRSDCVHDVLQVADDAHRPRRIRLRPCETRGRWESGGARRRERQLEGIAKAKAAGVYKGRPPSSAIMLRRRPMNGR
jgi:hypothetical protein